MEEPEIRIKPQTGIGRDLYQLSVAELEHYHRRARGRDRPRAGRDRSAGATCAGPPRRMFRRPPGAGRAWPMRFCPSCGAAARAAPARGRRSRPPCLPDLRRGALPEPQGRGRQRLHAGRPAAALPPGDRAAARLLDDPGGLSRAGRDGRGGGLARGLGGGARPDRARRPARGLQRARGSARSSSSTAPACSMRTWRRARRAWRCGCSAGTQIPWAGPRLPDRALDPRACREPARSARARWSRWQSRRAPAGGDPGRSRPVAIDRSSPI